MRFRHIFTISSDKKDIKRAVVSNGLPMYTQYRQETLNLHNASDTSIRDTFGDYLDRSFFVGDNLISLQEMYDKSESLLSDNSLTTISKKMFPSEITGGEFYASYAGISVLTGTMVAQEGTFNPEGQVTIADLLDGLNAIKFGANANNKRKRSLDNISNIEDFFNEGYNSVVWGMSSPFFNLYTRKELVKPVTRLELAYITVVCWERFKQKFNTLYGGDYYLGITFDWEAPSHVLKEFSDGFDYKVSKMTNDDDIVILDLREYKENTVSEYLDNIKAGNFAIPMPMFMSLVELSRLGVFCFEDSRLDPMKEVSRGEFSFFINRVTEVTGKAV